MFTWLFFELWAITDNYTIFKAKSSLVFLLIVLSLNVPS